ncbi:ZFAN1-like protein [Mya arenaria]|uniref:ZFAN1-like protein n=2 Tax=Mya arenaria TaxID=6604 RepID=A0ABY7EY05_MYAAR|nr:ZFAN1-like protein [Mya arenaria]
MKCQLSFCLSHRHAQDHQCSKLGTNKTDTNISKTAEHVNKILETKKAAPKKSKPLNAKASKTAARVALMKMKMTAVGDGSCPEEERLYLKVLPPQGSNTQSQTMFFSKVWSVGRVIDNISDRLKLTNNNNVENAKKLRLFSTLTGDLYPTDCDVGSLLQGELLYSGSSVILEYVDNDCTCISDLTLYSAS